MKNPNDNAALAATPASQAGAFPPVHGSTLVARVHGNGYTEDVIETKWGKKHQWRKEKPNGNRVMITIVNPTDAQLAVVRSFTLLSNSKAETRSGDQRESPAR